MSACARMGLSPTRTVGMKKYLPSVSCTGITFGPAVLGGSYATQIFAKGSGAVCTVGSSVSASAWFTRQICHTRRRRSVLLGGSTMTWNQLRPTADLVGSVGSTNGCVDSKSVSREPSPKKRIPSGNSQPKSKDSESENYPATYVKADGRIIAIGDVHGDLTKTLQCLELAGVLGRDDCGRPVWVGGNTVVVQMGDVMDRGDCEIGIVMLLRQLHKMAQKDGGAVYMLNGNHESLNVCGDYRYVTAGAFLEAAMAAGLKDEQAESWENQLRARVRLYSPGGPMAMELSKNPTVLVVNDTVFAHGGLLPEHATYGLERVNREVCRWMRGEKNPDGTPVSPPFLAMGDSNSIMWNRMYSRERFPNPYEKFQTCSALAETLEKVRAKRLVVGHTPQMEGANCECDEKVWRVDVGMSSGVLDAAPEVIEINGTGSSTVVKVLSADSLSQVAAKNYY